MKLTLQRLRQKLQENKKLADEKAKLAREAAGKVAAANRNATAATKQARAEAVKAKQMKTKLDQANAKIAGREFVRASPYGAVPGYQIAGRKHLGDAFNVGDPNSCKKLAAAKGANVWGHRNASHPNAKYRNSCFFYKTNPATKYGGNKGDKIHMIGCSISGNPKTGCTAVPAKASSMSTTEAGCYLLRYKDLRDAFGTNTKKAQKHWKDHGFKEKRNKTCSPINIALKYKSKWCADEGHRMICNRGAIGGWEKQQLHHITGNTFAIKGGKDKKWCADEGHRIKCNRGAIGGWEKFKVYPRNGNKIRLKGGKINRYCKKVGNDIKCNTRRSRSAHSFNFQNW